MEQPLSLAGIPILLENRLEYLFQLARAVALEYAELQPLLGELRVDTSVHDGDRWDKIEPAILGYSRQNHIYELLVKDWADTDRNECDVLTNYLQERQLLKGLSSAYICGAGLGRLADYLGGVAGLERVTCSDLSWIALYFGRLMMEGREQELPPFVRRPRFVLDADETHTRVSQRSVPLAFKKPRIGTSCAVSFEVRDAFAYRPVDADIVLVCNFVETFRGRMPATVTAQIARQVHVGQRALHVTWVSPEQDTGRRPDQVVELFRRCGFDVDWLDFILLPYSGGNWCIDSSKSEWKNLVLMATKRSEADEDGIYLDLNRRDAWLCQHTTELIERGVLNWAGGISTVVFTEVERAMLRALSGGLMSLAALKRQLSAAPAEFEHAVARLTSRMLITAQVDAEHGAAVATSAASAA